MENPNHAMKSNESLKTLDPSSTSSTDASRSSNAIRSHPSAPPPPRPSSSGLPSSKNECAICLDEMSKGDGKAVFTAECSHSFHFDCITANVKHGNRICPLCRTQWQQVPLFLDNRIPLAPPPPPPVPTLPPQMGFEDDELLPQTQAQAQNDNDGNHQPSGPPLDIKLLPQVSSVAKQVTLSDFAVLVHLKAGVVSDDDTASRAPLDLVAVLDVSGSMDGPKMELLKNAVTFVIQNLGETDRLSVVTFSSTARRVFPLRLMSETGKQAAIRAVNSLVADGCTNIAEGLKIGARVIADRRCRNPVPVMMLLSDGQDNYTFSHFETRHRTDYESLIPSSGSRIPIHTFGFGSDHDAELMHTISRVSSGTFSFIETETVIRDAFAQCIGGLLSTVVLEQVVEIECVHEEGLKITSVKAGSYRNNVASDRRSATINVGDMYAEEERDFLVVLEIPTSESESMALVKVRCVYKDPVSRETILVESEELTIQRPEELNGEEIVVSIEVDRQRNRFLVSQAISEAKVLADGGDVRAAAELLRKSERDLSETVSARSGDSLCASLTTELRALQEKMTSRSRYQTSGRAYALSSMSANLAQRATSRYSPTVSGYAPTEPGYSPGPAGYSMPQAYQTSAMARMVTRSQQLGVQNPTPSPAPRDRT